MAKIMNRGLLRILALVFTYFTLFFVATIMLKLDFSKSNFYPADIIHMLPLSSILYLYSSCALLIIITKIVDSRLLVLIPIFLGVNLTIIFPVLQYPRIHSWDSFSHGLLADIIKNNGHIPDDAGYSVYPGAFELSAVFSQITGCSTLIAGIFLASFLKLLIVIFLLLVGRIIVTPEKSYLVPTIFLSFYLQFYTGLLHYCPQVLGFCLFIYLVWVFARTIHYSTNREVMFLLFFLTMVLTMVHPFSSLVAVITLLCIYFIGNKFQSPLKLRNGQRISFYAATVSFLIFVCWNLFVAQVYFDSSVRSLSLILQHGKGYSLLDVLIYNPAPGALTRILAYYRYGIYSLFGLMSFLCILLFRRQETVKFATFLFLGAVLEGVAVYFTPATFGVGRLVLFVGVPVSFLSSYLIKNLKVSVLSKLAKFLELITPFLVISSFLVANLYVSSYTLFVHPDEVSAAQFAAIKIERPVSTIIDNALVIQFFNGKAESLQIKNYPPGTVKEMLNKADVSLQYMPRQKYYFNLSFVEDYHNLVYSNGLCCIYTKPNAN